MGWGRYKKNGIQLENIGTVYVLAENAEKLWKFAAWFGLKRIRRDYEKFDMNLIPIIEGNKAKGYKIGLEITCEKEFGAEVTEKVKEFDLEFDIRL